MATSPLEQHEIVALPAKKLSLVSSTYAASDSAAATLVPDGDDALEEGLSAAFDDAFAAVDAASNAPTVKLTRAAVLKCVPGDPSEDLAHACAALALDKKADDVVILKVADLSSYADYFVIAAAPLERQVQAIARNVTEELKLRSKLPLSVDGLDQGNWVIVDYGSVVLHCFLQYARRYYDLDGFWVDAPRVSVDEQRGLGALSAM